MIAVCKTNYFKELTRGQEYHIVDAYNVQRRVGSTEPTSCAPPDAMFVVINNSGQKRAYHSSYFI